MSKESTKLRICLITFPLSGIKGGHILVENLLKIIEPLAEHVFLITGNYPQSAVFSPRIHLRSVKYNSRERSTLLKILKHIVTQVKMCYDLVLIAGKIDIVIFFAEGTTLVLLMLVAKLLGKKAILIATGSGRRGAEQQFKRALWGRGGSVFYNIIAILEGFNRSLSNMIVVESPSLVSWLGLDRYQKRISDQGGLFVDIDLFMPNKRVWERKNIVGYFGRLSEEKGVMSFIRAIPLILSQCDEVEFLIGGDGALFSEIKAVLKDFGPKVRLTGWIAHEKLPDFLNEPKLVVIPSYTEGLPNIMLEAMACGTPVLATPVGGIPDVIEDNKTGLILETNSSECIAKDVVRALSHPNLTQISNNARGLIERKYTYEAAVERYHTLLEGLTR